VNWSIPLFLYKNKPDGPVFIMNVSVEKKKTTMKRRKTVVAVLLMIAVVFCFTFNGYGV